MAWHRTPACRPDLVSVGKSLGAGFPVAALLLTDAMAATTKPGEHGSTFGAAPLACAAILGVLDAIAHDDLLARARSIDVGIRAAVADLPAVLEVRGRGCLLGVALDRPAAPVARALLADGFLVGGANDPRCLRLCPPAVLPFDAIDSFATALKRALEAA